MALTQADHLALLQALLPAGPAWADAVTRKLIEAWADECTRLDGRIQKLLEEADTRVTGELLAEWERLLGLPDECVPTRIKTLAPGLYPDLKSASLKSFVRSSTGTYFETEGVLQTAAVNVPRFDHDPVTGEPLGLLVEAAATNLLLRSQEFDNASWTKSLITVTANAVTAPDGTLTADMLTNTGTGGDAYVGSAFTTPVGVVHSIFVKQGTAPQAQLRVISFASFVGDSPLAFDFASETFPIVGAATASGFFRLTGGWYRLWAFVPTQAGQTGGELRVRPDRAGGSTAGDTLYVWGAQVESGDSVSSYISTTTATATRSADVATVPVAQPIPERRLLASAKLTEQGGQSRAYFIDLAARYGEPGCTITEFQQMTCNSDCNDALYSQADEFVWRVNVPRPIDQVQAMTCNDDCNDALASFTVSLAECPIQERKPAHTTVIFSYA